MPARSLILTAGLENGTRIINKPESHVEDYWSRHPEGANMLFEDGSVRFFKNSINPTPWRALATSGLCPASQPRRSLFMIEAISRRRLR